MDDIELLIRQLYSSYDVRYGAATRLRAIGLPAIEHLINILSGQYFPKLSQIPVHNRFSQLETILCYWLIPSRLKARGQYEVAFILGDIGDKRAVDALLRAFQEGTNKFARYGCVSALCKLLLKFPDPRIPDILLKALDKNQIQDYPAIAAIHALVTIHDPRIIDKLIDLLKLPKYDAALSNFVPEALGKLGDVRAIEPLGNILINSLPGTPPPEQVIRALAKIGDVRAGKYLLAFVRSLLQYPAEKWDNRSSNMGENDWGGLYHVRKFLLSCATNALNKVGDDDTLAELKQLLDAAPSYIPRE